MLNNRFTGMIVQVFSDLLFTDARLYRLFDQLHPFQIHTFSPQCDYLLKYNQCIPGNPAVIVLIFLVMGECGESLVNYY